MGQVQHYTIDGLKRLEKNGGDYGTAKRKWLDYLKRAREEDLKGIKRNENKKYRHKNREHLNKYGREYQQKPEVKERNKEYYLKNREKICVRSNKYYHKNKERINQIAKAKRKVIK